MQGNTFEICLESVPANFFWNKISQPLKLEFDSSKQLTSKNRLYGLCESIFSSDRAHIWSETNESFSNNAA